MKKTLMVAGCALLLTGCFGSKNEFNEGEYTGEASTGIADTATATVTIDSDGNITAVSLDSTYTTDAGVETTKKTLGDFYGMKIGNSEYGVANLEWYEQIKILEDKIIEDQGVTNIVLGDNDKTDSVSGCTVEIAGLINAFNNAMEKAKAE